MKIVFCTLHVRRSIQAVSLAAGSLAAALQPDLRESCVLIDSFPEQTDQDILASIMASAPDLVAFPVYVWNRQRIIHLARELHQLAPQLYLIAGGPEATGPLWGDGGTSASGLQETLERSVVEQTPELVQLFSTTRMKPERRPLRARPAELAWQWREEGCLQVEFTLAPGQYATTILSDIFELEDMSLGRHNKQQG